MKLYPTIREIGTLQAFTRRLGAIRLLTVPSLTLWRVRTLGRIKPIAENLVFLYYANS
jgi:hypothetical protein